MRPYSLVQKSSSLGGRQTPCWRALHISRWMPMVKAKFKSGQESKKWTIHWASHTDQSIKFLVNRWQHRSCAVRQAGPSKRKAATVYVVTFMERCLEASAFESNRGKVEPEGSRKGVWGTRKTRKIKAGRNFWASITEERGRNICSQHRLKKAESVQRFHAQAIPDVKDITGPLAPP